MNEYEKTYITNEDRSIGNLVHELDKKIYAAYNAQLKQFDLTFPQALALLLINSHPQQEVYQKNLEVWMGLTNPSVTSLIKTMISKDFIYRIQSKKDARYFHLHLTPKALNIINDIPDVLNQENEKFLSPLSIEEQETLKYLLIKLA